LENTYTIFLGAFLAFLATALVEVIKNIIQSRNTQKKYKMFARLQLISVLKILNKLKHTYENSSRYLPRDIALLEKASEPLNSIRNDNTILKKADLQEQLIDLIADLNLYISDVKSLSADSGDDESETMRSSWMSKNMELIDLRRRIEDLSKHLSDKKSEL